MKNNPHRWFDWFSAVLLVLAFATVTIRMRVTDWTSNLEVIETLGFFASILGIMLGASRFSPLAAQLFGLNFTIFFVPWQLGLLVGTNIPWDERLLSLINRLVFSINEVANNRPIQDSLLFLTSMAFFFWILAIVAGYQLARHGRPWGPLAVLGLTLAIVDFYTPYQAFRDRYSAVFVFFLLILVARLYLLHSRYEWTDKGMAVDPEIGFDLGRTVAVSGLVLVVAAWNFPTLVDALTPGTDLQRQLAQQWEGVRDHLQNAVSGLQNQVSIVSDYFGPDLALGTSGALGDEVIFSVQATEGRLEDYRYYWKARSFDVYDGTQWKTTLEKTRTVGANEWPFQYPQYQARKEVVLLFQSYVTSMRNLYAPGMVLQVSRPADVLAQSFADGTVDEIALVSNPALRGGEIFRLRSWVATPTVPQLKASTDPYPAEIKSLYLQLPPNLSPKIPALAKEITTGLTNRFDQVVAVTEWLRKNISYEPTITPAPQGVDILEYFLFTQKKGYCNYYASAEVIMLRSLGIPARLAVGYAEGESERNGDTFTVRRRDSHAWPEVFFSGYGWIEFEPTVSQPVLAYPTGEEKTSSDLNSPFSGGLGDFSSEEPTPQPVGGNYTVPQDPAAIARFVVVPVGGGALFLLFFWLRRSGRLRLPKIPIPVIIAKNLERRGVNPPSWLKLWADHLELSPMQRMFVRTGWMLRLLGEKSSQAQTPAERISLLTTAVPLVKSPAAVFLVEYQHEEYSTQAGDFKLSQAAYQLMWRIVLNETLHRLVTFSFPHKPKTDFA